MKEDQQQNRVGSIPKPVYLLPQDTKDKRKLIIVLEKAGLEVFHLKHQNILLNSDEHTNIIQQKLKKDPGDYRPDITHQCLLTLLDSPLNKAGLLKIYITTIKNQVIQIHPSTRIPRTYKRFAPLMAQLLKKLRIRAEETSETLLKIIKNPVNQHLPVDCLKIGTSVKARYQNINQFANRLSNNQPIVFVIGAVAKGDPAVNVDYIQESICISKYPLSAAYCLSKILYAFQDKWKIL